MRHIKVGLLILLGFLCNISYVAAYSNYDEGVDPYYAGFEFKAIRIEGQGDWDRIFTKTYVEPGFFFGGRFCGMFRLNYAIEVGYNWSITEPKKTLIAPGTTFLGEPNDTNINSTTNAINGPGNTIEAIGRLRLKSGYVDLNAYIPFLLPAPYECYYPELILTAGIAATRPIIEIQSDPLGTVNTANLDTLDGILPFIQGRGKTTFRAGIGLQFQIGYYVGLRAMLRYETFSWLRPRPGVDLDQRSREHMLSDAYSASLGIYYTFLPF